MKNEVIEAIHQLAKEKDINEEMLFNSIEEALKAAYRKNLGRDEVEPANIIANMNREDGSIHIYARLLVVEDPKEEDKTADKETGAENGEETAEDEEKTEKKLNPALQIPLSEARKIRPNAEIDDIVDKEVTPKGFLRVAALSAKQVLMQRIRDAERGRIYDEYVEKTDEILTGVVQRISDYSAIVELGHTEGILENEQMIPGEVLHEGDHIKVYVLEVGRGGMAARMPQVRVSRIHPALVKRLFEMEVPEIAAGLVTIKSIAREAGSRTKMAVHSNDPMIDPVGACVGQRGGRVDRVVQELKGEKIDIIKWSEDSVEFVANALNPAHVMTVYTTEHERVCRVVVPDNQLSLAIGKEGQNARLAAKLTGWKIDIKSQSQAAEMPDMIDDLNAGGPIMTPMEYDPYAGVPTDDDTL